MAQRRNCMTDYQDKFQKVDCHTHCYSHCVFKRMGIKYWDNETSFEEKTDFIKSNMRRIFENACAKNLTVLAITDHAQAFSAHNIPFQWYLTLFRDLQREYQDRLKSRLGFELNIKRNPMKGIFIDLSELSNETSFANEMVKQADFLLCAEHPQDHTTLSGNNAYLDLLLRGIEYFRRIADRMAFENPLVLAHPWQTASILNDIAYKKLSPEQQPSTLDDYLNSGLAPILHFDEDQLRILCRALVDNKVIPEINGFSIDQRVSDITAQKTIVGSYINYCFEFDTPPLISIGSDAHKPDQVGDTNVGLAREKIPNFEEAVVWCV